MNKRRVVITGIGTVNSVGNDVKSTWDGILAGKSGIAPITNFDVTNFPIKIGGEIKNLDPLSHIDESTYNKAKKLDKVVLLAAIASQQAIENSGIDISKNPSRAGVAIGTGIGGKVVHSNTTFNYLEKGYKSISPYFIPGFIGNAASGFVSIEHGITGSSLGIQTACASSNHALIFGMMSIQMGLNDVYICGGSEYTVEIITVSAFHRLRALSIRYNDTPEKASRPFDKHRDGFVIAEGSSVLVLEEYEHAKNRGADIYCEVAGFGMSADAYDLVKPEPDGKGAYATMEQAINYGGIHLEEVNYINTHATSTPVGDISEARSITNLFAGNTKQLKIGSTKSMTGHSLGSISALEAIVCCMVIRDGKIPPNINLEELDDQIELDEEVFNKQVVEKDVKIALSNSFGFGGHNATIAFKKIEK